MTLKDWIFSFCMCFFMIYSGLLIGTLFMDVGFIWDTINSPYKDKTEYTCDVEYVQIIQSEQSFMKTIVNYKITNCTLFEKLENYNYYYDNFLSVQEKFELQNEKKLTLYYYTPLGYSKLYGNYIEDIREDAKILFKATFTMLIIWWILYEISEYFRKKEKENYQNLTTAKIV